MLYKRIFWKSQQERLWDVLRNTRYLETNGRKQVMRKEGKSSIIHACTLLESPSQSRFIECVLSHFSHVRFFVTLWTVARQATLSMGLSRQEYWSGLPCPPLGDLPDPGIEPRSPALQADSLPSELQGKLTLIILKFLHILNLRLCRTLTVQQLRYTYTHM